MDKKILLAFAACCGLMFGLTSCGGQKNLIVPRAVSTAGAIPVSALNMQKGDYDILASVTENASVTAHYSSAGLKIQSGDGDFAYTFKFNNKTGWNLHKFSGTATFGYLLSDINNSPDIPNAEEFARRVAISRLIETIKDYGADGVLEPIVTTRASNSGRGTVEYQASVTAKIVKVHPSAN